MKDQTNAKRKQSDAIKLTILPTPHQEFKNYRELVGFLGLPILEGDSKTYQLKQLSNFFTWTKQGNKFIIEEVYNKPLELKSNRGKSRPLQEYQTLFKTVMLYELLYGAIKDHPLGEESNVVSYTKTELRQKLFKLVNKDYYNARKDIRRAGKELGLDERVIKMGDGKVTDKIGEMNYLRPFEELEEYGVKVDTGFYVYYIKVGDYLEKNDKIINCRMATEEEEEIIRAAGNIGTWEYEEEYKDLGWEEKMDPETHKEKRGREILRNKLKILNGTDDIDKVVGEILAADMEREKKPHTEEAGKAGGQVEGAGTVGTGGGTGGEGDKDYNPDGYFEKYVEAVSERIRERRDPEKRGDGFFTKELIEMIKKGDGLNRYALERGEFWVNIIEKVRFRLPKKSKFTLVANIGSLTDKIMTMPEAQVKLNQYMLDWFDDKADNKWGGFGEKFLNESATGSKDIGGDLKKFAKRYIGLKGVERTYEWQEYGDDEGKRWKVRYAGNKMTFDEENLVLLLGKFGEEKAGGKAVIIWNAPLPGLLCTNCKELVELARGIWTERGWMPIEGYMGGICDEEKDGGRGEEIGCFILDLGDVGAKILKEEWEKRKNNFEFF